MTVKQHQVSSLAQSSTRIAFKKSMRFKHMLDLQLVLNSFNLKNCILSVIDASDLPKAGINL